MTRGERDWIDGVDDSILVQAHGIARLRNQTIRASVEDVRQTFVGIMDDSNVPPGETIWGLRVERCNIMLSNPDDSWLRRRAAEAVEHDRGNR